MASPSSAQHHTNLSHPPRHTTPPHHPQSATALTLLALLHATCTSRRVTVTRATPDHASLLPTTFNLMLTTLPRLHGMPHLHSKMNGSEMSTAAAEKAAAEHSQ